MNDTTSLSSALATGNTANIASALRACGPGNVAADIANLDAQEARKLAQALYSTHYGQRDRDEAAALRALEQYFETAETTKAALQKFRTSGVAPLTVPQAQAVLEVLRFVRLLDDVCGTGDRMAEQFVEAITDTTGFSTVEEIEKARLTACEPPAAPGWPGSISGDLGMELFECYHRLSFAVVTASVCATASRNSAAVVEAMAD